ncbi:MAG TPA: class I adenylate-forming enzyme family protein [Thermodesulfobacteriota bacterium]|nr:class I adenylate-forming enzyme family protein [Thermodesulfobacteriota bacterium]
MVGPCSWLYRASRRWPKKEAIFDAELSLSFEDLHENSLRVAKWLGLKGGPGQRIVIALPFSVTTAVLYFGILFAGMVAVPVDTGLSPNRFGLLLEEIDPLLVIASSDLDSKPCGDNRKWWVVNNYQDLDTLTRSVNRKKDLPALDDDPLRLLHVIYTSGTSGLSKGVMLHGANLEAVAVGIEKTVVINEDHTIFTALSFAHTYGLSHLWLMARRGASLGVLQDITRMAVIKEIITGHRVDVIAGVPYHFAMFTRRGEKERWDGVRLVTVAGDAPSRTLIQRMKVSFPNAKILIMYGLTEASTRLTVLPPEDLERKDGSIGLPIQGVELKVIDENGEELGPHQAGELIARGANITPGYWKDERLTRKTIINGWLRSGDIVMKDEEGYYYHLGRKDSVFKSGGEKIVPEAIEKVLRETEGVRDAAVIGKEDLYRGNTICAVIVKEEGSDLSPGKVISICQARLDRLWTPHEVVFAEEIPRSPNGKIRYDLLRERFS